MKKLNFVDWAWQGQSIFGMWQPKLNMKGKMENNPIISQGGKSFSNVNTVPPYRTQ